MRTGAGTKAAVRVRGNDARGRRTTTRFVRLIVLPVSPFEWA